MGGNGSARANTASLSAQEFKSKVFICLRGNESFMLKWEIAANEWRRYERHLRQLMDSFVVQP